MSEPPGSRRGPLTWVLVGAVVVAGGVLLVPRLTGPGETGDAVYVTEGETKEPPAEAAELVGSGEVVEAEVAADNRKIVLSARMSAPVPTELDSSSIDWHWELTGSDGKQWIVSASLNVALNAAVLAQDGSHSSTTIDGSMPGTVRSEGYRVIVRLNPSEIDDFPPGFTWVLTTVVVGDRSDPETARVEDSFPNEGRIEFGSIED